MIIIIIQSKFKKKLFIRFLGLLDGKHSLDEVCCETNKSLKEVEAILKGIEGINMIYK